MIYIILYDNFLLGQLPCSMNVFFVFHLRSIPVTYHQFEENGNVVRLPYLRPSDTLRYLLRNEPWLVLGGLRPGQETHQLLSAFWDLYRNEHGSHAVYKMARENKVLLSHTIPVFLHGDGGRTQKKTPLEVVSIRPALGIDTEESPLQCSCSEPVVYHGIDKGDALSMRLNQKNHSYLTHFLVFAFPSKKYKATPGLLHSLLEAMSMDLKHTCCDGISVGGTTYHFAVLGMSGDMEYHAKTGVLNRSYQNVGHRNFIPCCHECQAGDFRWPFEDVSSNPKWTETLYATPPWRVAPPFKHIPFEDWDTGDAARFFKKDPFHIFRLGIARNFIGSTIVIFCLEGVFDYEGSDSLAIDARLSRAWSSFTLWCDANHVTPAAIRSFSKEKLHLPTMGSFPWCGGKGSDSILLIKWLKFVSGIHGGDHADQLIFRLVFKACDGGLAFQCVHAHGTWLMPTCRTKIIQVAKHFDQSYARLAHYAYAKKWQLYAMVPKVHAFNHFPVQLGLQEYEDYSLNPALFDCSMSEDFIGRVSKQSRRVSFVQVVENTILAYKVKAKSVIKKFKKKRFG